MSDDTPRYETPGMAFPILKSEGGPYDDDAFEAGWNLSVLNGALLEGAESGNRMPIHILRTNYAVQVDLLAMKHGFITTSVVSETHPDFSYYYFTLIPTEPDMNEILP